MRSSDNQASVERPDEVTERERTVTILIQVKTFGRWEQSVISVCKTIASHLTLDFGSRWAMWVSTVNDRAEVPDHGIKFMFPAPYWTNVSYDEKAKPSEKISFPGKALTSQKFKNAVRKMVADYTQGRRRP